MTKAVTDGFGPARCGMVRSGMVEYGLAGGAWRRWVWNDAVGRGEARRGMVRSDVAVGDRQGSVEKGKMWHGAVRQVRLGPMGQGYVRWSTAWLVWTGRVRCVMDRRGRLGWDG